MEKKLKIGLELDDKAFTSAIKRMQDQLNQLQNPSNLMRQQQQISQKMQSMGLGPLPGTPSYRQVEQEQQKAKQESNKIFEETKRKMEIIKRLQKEYNEELKKTNLTQEKSLELKQKLADLGVLEKRATGELSVLTGRLGGGAPIPSKPAATDIGELTKKVLGILGIGVGASALVNLGKEVYSSYVSLPYRISMATGGAVQSTLGYQNQNLLSGNIAQATATQGVMAEARRKATKAYDLSPEAWFNLDRMVERAVSDATFGLVKNTAFGQQYQATRAQTIGGNTTAIAQKLLDENNNLQLALSFFNQTFERNVAAERAFGLGTDQFRRMQTAAGTAGFTTDQTVSMLGQIQGAGGSVSGSNASPLGILGLQMQRGFNLTNAGNVLGKLSGLYGPQGGAQIDEATKRILQDSIAKGFDKSENTEILRRFTETTAQIIYTGEGKTPQDVDRLARDLLQLLPTNASTKQFEAASSAYQKIQQATSATSGRGGALGFAAFLGNKSFSNLSALQIANLQALPEGMITATNTDVINAAAQQGISPQQMVTAILSAKQQQQLSTGGLTQGTVGTINKYLGGRDISSVVRNYSELNKLRKTNPQVYKAINQLQQRANLVAGNFSSDEEKVRMMEGLLRGPAGYQALTPTTEVTKTLTGGIAGKREEVYIAQQAAAKNAMVDNLTAMEKQIYSTAGKITELTKTLLHSADAIDRLNEGERARAALLSTPLGPVTAPNQNPMTRTPSSGSKSKHGS